MQVPQFRKVKAHVPCPACGLHNFIDEPHCKHCGRVFNEVDKQAMQEQLAIQKAKGNKMGLVVVGVLLIVLLATQLAS